jgi:hypothetical protein
MRAAALFAVFPVIRRVFGVARLRCQFPSLPVNIEAGWIGCAFWANVVPETLCQSVHLNSLQLLNLIPVFVACQ